MKRILTFLLFFVPVLLSAQVHNGTYQMRMQFSTPAPNQNLSFDCVSAKLLVSNDVPSIIFEFRIMDPRTSATNHRILKGTGTGSFSGDNLRIEGSATFDTYENDKNDMHSVAAVIVEGLFSNSGNQGNITGSFKILKEGTAFFAGSFAASPAQGEKFRLIRGTAELQRAGENRFSPVNADQAVEITAGDQVHTGTGSLAEIIFPDSSILRLKSSAILTLQSNGAQVTRERPWLICQYREDPSACLLPMPPVIYQVLSLL